MRTDLVLHVMPVVLFVVFRRVDADCERFVAVACRALARAFLVEALDAARATRVCVELVPGNRQTPHDMSHTC